MKKLIASAGLAAIATTLFVPALASAEEAASPLSFNVGVVSDYRYRGISQTRLKPALQGGADYAFSSGFYVGTWLSTIKWIKDFGGDSNVEWDLYGGYKGTINSDFSYDVGVLRYQYQKNKLVPSANTTELYGALTYGPATFKYSRSTTSLFGFGVTGDSKGSGYFDLSATFDVGGFAVTPHLGYQDVANYSDFSYTDYSLTVGKEVAPGLTLTAALVGADTKSIGGVKAYASPANGKDLGRSGLVLGLKYAF
ncbi:MAG: TorF family putative porin [Burkholderiales bacterium]